MATISKGEKAAKRRGVKSPKIGPAGCGAGGAEEGSSLEEKELHDAEERVAPHAAIVCEAMLLEGPRRTETPPSALECSDSAAGLSMEFSFVAEGR